MTIIQDEKMKEIINDYNDGLSPESISKKYREFSPYIIRENLKRIGIYQPQQKFSDNELETLQEDYKAGANINQLSEKYHKCPETIRRKLQSFGLLEILERNPYSDYEINILKTYYPIGDWDNLLKFLPNRNKSSINVKASSLGIHQENYRWTKDEIITIMANQGYRLLSDFSNIKDKHTIIDTEGYKYYVQLTCFTYNSYKPNRFSTENIYTIDNIKHYIQIKNIDSCLLSDNYIRNTLPLIWKCHCGDVFNCSWADFYSGKHQCNKCSMEDINAKKSYTMDEVKEMICDRPYTMIDETFTNLSNGFMAITDDGYYVIINKTNIYKNSIPEKFHKNNPYTIRNINHYININNIQTKLLSTEYVSNNSKLIWRCSCGKEFEKSWNSFLQGSIICKDCANIEKYRECKEKEFEDVKQYFIDKNYQLLSQEYINCYEKLEYICNRHKDKGIQEITWASCKHKNAGCKYCAHEKLGISRRIPELEIKQITESKGFIYDHVEYSASEYQKTLIYFKCPNHIEKGLQVKCLADMKKSSGKCTYCLGKERTHEEFLELMKGINPNITILSEYINTVSDIKCRCNIDGYEWISNGSRLLTGAGCIKCAKRRQGQYSTKSNDVFVSEIHNRYNGRIALLSEYTGSHDPIHCKCTIHNTEWTTTPTTLLSASVGCPTCISESTSERCRKSNEQFIKELSQINPTIIPLEEYTGGKNKIKCKCTIHQYEWYVSPNKILTRKTGCPKCASYHNENKIDEILDKLGLKYTAQKRFPDCKNKYPLPFDRYLDDFNILIEYDGEGHYKPIRRGHMTEEDAEENLKQVQFRDNIKNEYCKQNNIPLIRIPYWEKDNLEEFLLTNLSKYNVITVN